MTRVNFHKDSVVERSLRKHFDDFYKGIKLDFRRNFDDETQLLGVDGVIKSPDYDLVVDEKAATSYCNTRLMTLAFELSFILNRGSEDKRMLGWFMDDLS